MLLQCSEFTQGGSTECLNRSHLFKICLKRLFKKLCKLQKLKRPSENDDEVVFVPELLSDYAIQNLTLFLQESNGDHPIQVVTLFTCPKVVFDLQHKSDLESSIKRTTFYALAFNDQLLKYQQFEHLNQENKDFCDYLFKKMATKKQVKNRQLAHLSE